MRERLGDDGGLALWARRQETRFSAPLIYQARALTDEAPGIAAAEFGP